MVEGPDWKRQKGNAGNALVPFQDDPSSLRASSLPAATLQLTGHQGSVYSLEYSPNGETLCSTSFDKTCLLWNHTDNYVNFNVLQGHKNAVLDCRWCDNETLVTASADKTLMLWDVTTGTRLRKWASHTAIVNACDTLCVNETSASSTDVNSLVSASDDGTCLLWDRREKRPTGTLSYDGLPITAVAASDTHVYTGSVDNKIVCWDLKKMKKSFAMSGHHDTITCLALHPEGTHILSNSMDSTLKSWDIRPFAGKNRHEKTFVGHRHNAEKGLLKCAWSPDGKMVTAGSADRMVHVWDEFSTEELYLLPGHKGCVNTVAFHPVEHVIASGSSDKHIFVGELS